MPTLPAGKGKQKALGMSRLTASSLPDNQCILVEEVEEESESGSTSSSSTESNSYSSDSDSDSEEQTTEEGLDISQENVGENDAQESIDKEVEEDVIILEKDFPYVPNSISNILTKVFSGHYLVLTLEFHLQYIFH